LISELFRIGLSVCDQNVRGRALVPRQAARIADGITSRVMPLFTTPVINLFNPRDTNCHNLAWRYRDQRLAGHLQSEACRQSGDLRWRSLFNAHRRTVWYVPDSTNGATSFGSNIELRVRSKFAPLLAKLVNDYRLLSGQTPARAEQRQSSRATSRPEAEKRLPSPL